MQVRISGQKLITMVRDDRVGSAQPGQHQGRYFIHQSGRCFSNWRYTPATHCSGATRASRVICNEKSGMTSMTYETQVHYFFWSISHFSDWVWMPCQRMHRVQKHMFGYALPSRKAVPELSEHCFHETVLYLPPVHTGCTGSAVIHQALQCQRTAGVVPFRMDLW